MQAASRESYQTARASLSNTTVETGEEILAFAKVLAKEPRLRRALSDPSRASSERAEFARQLLAGKVSEAALNPLATLVSGRWSAASELLDATERLGVDAILASADADGDLAEVEDELFRFGQIVAGDPKLASIVGDPSASLERRAELVRKLLEGKAKPATVRLAEQAVYGFGGRAFASGLTRLVELAAERREAEIAYVAVAEPLSEAEENRLAATLSRLYGKTISVKVDVDPAVLGGMSVRVGSDLYDGTVARRLATVRTALVAK
jgi:F-type H+-transporting ATPase subunit delta